jgi:hypothetical protein
MDPMGGSHWQRDSALRCPAGSIRWNASSGTTSSHTENGSIRWPIPAYTICPGVQRHLESGGTNTFTVTITDIQGHALQGASVLAQTTMLDMDMGTDVLQLQANPSSPGTFSGQSALTMAGHWQVRLRILPPHEQSFVIVVFLFATR